MKGPIATSVVLHIIILLLGVLTLTSTKKLEAGGESLPVEMVSIEELTQIQQGDKKAPKADKSAPVPTQKPADDPNAKNVGDNQTDVETPPKPAEKPKPVETANAPAPQPKPVKKPEETKPEEPKVDEVAKAIAQEEAAAAKAAEAAKKADAEAAKEAKAEAAKEAEAAKTKAAEAAKADAKAEEQAKIEAEALLKANADTKAAEEEKTAADKAAKEKVAAEKAEKAAKAEKEAAEKADKAAAEKEAAEAAQKAASDAAAEAEAKAAADAKAAKAAEAKAAKAAEAKKAAAAQAAEEKKLADDIKKALLNTDEGASGGKKKSTDQAALGGKKTTGGSKLSLSEMDALRGMIEKCWSPPTGIADAGSMKITVKMSLNQSGEIEGRPQVIAGGGGSGIERAAGEAARRAVLKCAPYNLPLDKYDAWSEVVVNFDPSELF
jgi:colicin import membrane protein